MGEASNFYPQVCPRFWHYVLSIRQIFVYLKDGHFSLATPTLLQPE